MEFKVIAPGGGSSINLIESIKPSKWAEMVRTIVPANQMSLSSFFNLT